jgi:hypothetical protein
MSAFEDFIDVIKSGVKDLAKSTLKDFVDRAEEDFESFVESAKEDWKRWTTMLANGQLSMLEFEGLVRGQKDLAVMHALTEAGIAATRIQRFRDGVIALVIDTAFKTFL